MDKMTETEGKVVITRSLEQGQRFVSSFKAEEQGNFFFEPLLKIKNYEIHLPVPNSSDIAVVTSTNAVFCLEKRKDWHGLDYCCVGESVAHSLRDLGVASIVLTTPTAQGLCEAIGAHYGTEKKRFLYLHGHDVAYDMEHSLEALGHNVKLYETYEAAAKTRFTDVFLDDLKQEKISSITFFSRRTAEIFVKLVCEHDILAHLDGIKALCISDGVLECVKPVFGKYLEVSDSPDALGMRDLVRVSKHKM